MIKIFRNDINAYVNINDINYYISIITFNNNKLYSTSPEDSQKLLQ